MIFHDQLQLPERFGHFFGGFHQLIHHHISESRLSEVTVCQKSPLHEFMRPQNFPCCRENHRCLSNNALIKTFLWGGYRVQAAAPDHEKVASWTGYLQQLVKPTWLAHGFSRRNGEHKDEPFEDVSPIKNGGFPLLYVSLPEGICPKN